MRRKIELYIGGIQADLDDQNLILYNYAFTDLETPSAVKNSFSKQVTLPGTPANAKIFGHTARVDRVSTGGNGVGVGFNPGRKTSFTIYDEKRCVIERGYLRLDSVLRDGPVVKGYKCSLFGGMGSVFYALSYDDNGNKRTLADLRYVIMNDGEIVSEVTLSTFAINKNTILQAWTRLAGGAGAYKWDIINFAPAYNGKPDGDFSADKAYIKPAEIGLAETLSDDGTYYYSKDHQSLLNLAGGKDEWAAHDLRSYLQRPVLSWEGFMNAIAYAGEYWGAPWRVDISHIPERIYKGLWKTLPMIPSLGSFKQMIGDAELNYQQNQEEGITIATFDIDGQIPAGSRVTAKLMAQPRWQPNIDYSYTPETTHTFSDGRKARVLIFMQLVVYSGNVRIGGSKVKCLCDWTSRRGSSLAEVVNYTPPYDAEIEDPQAFTAVVIPNSGGRTYMTQGYDFEVSSNTPTVYRLQYRCFRIITYGDGDYEAVRSYDSYGLGVMEANGGIVEGEWQDLEDWDDLGVTYSSPAGPRSGAIVDPSLLLQSEHTPAEYLIAFAKMHGLVFKFDPDTQVLSILPRDDFFTGQVTDLSKRIDRGQQITIQPLSAASKWYELSGDMAEGAFAEIYLDVYGHKYGIQRVNTNYEFDDKAKDLMQGLALKGAVTILDNSAYWNIISDNGTIVPSLLVDNGNTYTLWDSSGKSKTFNVPCPPASATITYYNDILGYDIEGAAKLELRDADNSPVDGTDILCRLTGFKTYDKFHLSDDNAAMLELNGGKPCWDLTALASASVSVPCFGRYDGEDGMIDDSLDFGIPREVAVPDISFDPDTGSLYLRYWRAYLSDLLNENTKVMKCRVDFRGLEVGPGLLRKFYHYEGALWVLNKITNYSLTTYDAVECEFVQVQNPDNYTNGQILN